MNTGFRDGTGRPGNQGNWMLQSSYLLKPVSWAFPGSVLDTHLPGTVSRTLQFV